MDIYVENIINRLNPFKMKTDFKKWLIDEYGLQESAANSRVSNISTIEKYYGDIDTLIKNGSIQNLLNDLSYSTDDERHHREARHKIPIDGNVRTGSATLKQAVNRYVEFWRDTDRDRSNSTATAISNATELQRIANDLQSSLKDFRPTKVQKSYAIKEVKEYIQQPLTDFLTRKFPHIKWEMEYRLSDRMRDSVDIVGIVNDNTMIVIEIDTRRSDQISKKFVSRQALTDNMNTIYSIVTYPNTNSQSKAETVATAKYIKHIATITSLLMQATNLEKYVIAHNL